MREVIARCTCRRLGASASSTTTISSAGGAALEVGKAQETRRSMRALAGARLWACLGSARSRLGRRLGCRLRRRLCGPAISGCWQSSCTRARARRVASARANAVALDRQGTRDVAHVQVGPASTNVYCCRAVWTI